MDNPNKILRCDKFGCRPRANNFGVTWCTEFGKLFNFNMSHKPLDKNFLIKDCNLSCAMYV